MAYPNRISSIAEGATIDYQDVYDIYIVLGTNPKGNNPSDTDLTVRLARYDNALAAMPSTYMQGANVSATPTNFLKSNFNSTTGVIQISANPSHNVLLGLSTGDDHPQYYNAARAASALLSQSSMLSELAPAASATQARGNLGLSNASVVPTGTGTGAVVVLGNDPRFSTYAVKANNLNDVNAVSARANLGLGTVATQPSASDPTNAGSNEVVMGADSRVIFALKSFNRLSELSPAASASAARSNLGFAPLSAYAMTSGSYLVPSGGNPNQVLTKNTGTAYDFSWADANAAGAGALVSTNMLSELSPAASATQARNNLHLSAGATAAFGSTPGTIMDGSTITSINSSINTVSAGVTGVSASLVSTSGALQTNIVNASAASQTNLVNTSGAIMTAVPQVSLNTVGAAVSTGTPLSFLYSGNRLIFDAPEVVQSRAAYNSLPARLSTMDLQIAGGGPPLPPPPQPTAPSASPMASASPVPTGYASAAPYLMEFQDTNWLSSNGGPWVIQGGIQNQGKTGEVQSYNAAANVNTITTSGGMLEMRAVAEQSNGKFFTSSDVKPNSGGWWPLFGFYEAVVRFPINHCSWCCWWLNAANSASIFEIDICELFTAEHPGRSRTQVHSAATGYTVGNMIPWDSTTNAYGTTHYTYNSSAPTTAFYGPSAGSTRYHYSIDAYDCQLPSGGSGSSPWIKYGCEIKQVLPNTGSGWTVQFNFYINDLLWMSWTDDKLTDYQNGAHPAWYDTAKNGGATDQAFWAPRFDHWISGVDAARGYDTVNSKYVLGYDGLNNNNATNTSFVPVSPLTVPSAGKWIAASAGGNISNTYYSMDVAWLRYSAPTVTAPPPPPTSPHLFAASLTGANGTAVTPPGAGSNLSHYFLGTNAAITYDTTMSVPVSNATAVKLSAASSNNGCNVSYINSSGLSASYMGGWFQFAANPVGTNMIIHSVGPSTGIGDTGELRLLTDGRLAIYDRGGGGAGSNYNVSGSAPLNPNTWYYINCMFNANTAQSYCSVTDRSGNMVDQIQPSAWGMTGFFHPAPGDIYWQCAPGSVTSSTLTCWWADMIVDVGGSSPPPTPQTRTLLWESNQTGANGATVTTGTGAANAWTGRSPTNDTAGVCAMTYDTSVVSPKSSNPAIKFDAINTTGSTDIDIRWDPGGPASSWPQLYLRGWFKGLVLPSAGTAGGSTNGTGMIISTLHGTSPGGVTNGVLRWNNSGTLSMTSGGGGAVVPANNGTSTVTATSTVLAANTQYRIEWAVFPNDGGTPNAGTQIVRVYNSAGTLLEQLSGGANTFPIAMSAVQQFHVGLISTNANPIVTNTVWWNDLAADYDSTGVYTWIGDQV
jgi:hypothetical protein